jgi:hypothetical protein
MNNDGNAFVSYLQIDVDSFDQKNLEYDLLCTCVTFSYIVSESGHRPSARSQPEGCSSAGDAVHSLRDLRF